MAFGLQFAKPVRQHVLLTDQDQPQRVSRVSQHAQGGGYDHLGAHIATHAIQGDGEGFGHERGRLKARTAQ